MGNMLSTSSDEEVADGIAYPGRRDEEKYADIKLSCDSFMKFDGTLEKWFPFKKDVLARQVQEDMPTSLSQGLY